jgi:aldose 1-epimerase
LTEPGVLVLRAGAASLTLVPAAGGRASSLVVDGLELIAHDNDSAVGWGWYPMAPWPGRLRGNAVTWAGTSHPMPLTHQTWAIHGRVYDQQWQVEHADPASAVLGIGLGSAPGDPWPWPCDVRATWRLTPTSLETELEVTSRAAQFPAELGWHPWFRRVLDRGGPVVLDLPVTRMYVRGEDFLPTGELVTPPPGPYDDTFELPGGEVGLHWPGALRLRCSTDCGFVVVYDEPAQSVCVEPQTAPPDGINRDPGVVKPGQPRVARATWTWSLLASGA